MSGSDIHVDEENIDFSGVDSGYDADENRGPAPSAQPTVTRRNRACDEFWGTEHEMLIASSPKPIDFFNNKTNSYKSSMAVTSQIVSSGDQAKKVVCDW